MGPGVPELTVLQTLSAPLPPWGMLSWEGVTLIEKLDWTTVRLALAPWETSGLDPVTTIGELPAGVVGETSSVSLEQLPGSMWLGMKVPPTPAGAEVRVSWAMPGVPETTAVQTV